MNTISKIIAKLRDPEYRKAFVASQINIGIPFQIRALLKTSGLTQEEFARRAGMLQPRISAIQTPGKTRLNIETIRRIAEAFDCGLLIRFVPFSELVLRSEQFDPETFTIPSYEKEIEGGIIGSLPYNHGLFASDANREIRIEQNGARAPHLHRRRPLHTTQNIAGCGSQNAEERIYARR